MYRNLLTLSFFGHSEIEITEKLKLDLRNLIKLKITQENFGVFLFGGLGKFDELAWEIVSDLKKEYPHIKRIFVLTDEKHLQKYKRPKYLNDEDYEEFIYLTPQYDGFKKRIYYRNVEMINISDYTIFYVKHTENSGAYKAFKYAKLKKKPCTNLTIIEK